MICARPQRIVWAIREKALAHGVSDGCVTAHVLAGFAVCVWSEMRRVSSCTEAGLCWEVFSRRQCRQNIFR